MRGEPVVRQRAHSGKTAQIDDVVDALPPRRRESTASINAETAPIATAGAGPSSAIARTIARNAPRRGCRGSRRSAGRCRRRARRAARRARSGTSRPPWTSSTDTAIAAHSTDDLRGQDEPVASRHDFPVIGRSAPCLNAICGSGHGHSSGMAIFSWRTTIGWVRGRLAPLAVRPFNRLLSSYTLNELGDSVGIVALAVLVYDRTQAVAPTAAFFVAAKFLPALVAPALTARFDQVAAAPEPAGALRRRGDGVRRARADRRRRLRAGARARPRPGRRRARASPRARSRAARWPRCCSRPGC